MVIVYDHSSRKSGLLRVLQACEAFVGRLGRRDTLLTLGCWVTPAWPWCERASSRTCTWCLKAA